MLLIKFLFLTIFIMWLIRMVAKIILPVLLQGMVNKAQSQTYQQPNRRQYNRKPEGTLHVDFIPPKDREAKAADKAGDFVDYEEIK